VGAADTFVLSLFLTGKASRGWNQNWQAVRKVDNRFLAHPSGPLPGVSPQLPMSDCRKRHSTVSSPPVSFPPGGAWDRGRSRDEDGRSARNIDFQAGCRTTDARRGCRGICASAFSRQRRQRRLADDL